MCTLITDSEDQLIFPHNIKWISEVAFLYSLQNFNPNSRFIVLERKTPYELSQDAELRVWYSEDLKDFFTWDNSGKTCIDIYAQFKESFKGKLISVTKS